jgi:hypothetical protein
MKYFIFLFVFILGSAFDDTLYNYDTRSPGNDVFSFKGESSEEIPKTSKLPSTVITDKEYAALASDDSTYLDSKATDKKTPINALCYFYRSARTYCY